MIFLLHLGMWDLLGLILSERGDLYMCTSAITIFTSTLSPALHPTVFEEVIYVPDRGFNKWIASHPVGYINLLTQLNDTNGRKVRPLTKLLKHFRDAHMQTRRPKSYWLGALVVHHITRQDSLNTSQPLAVLFRDLLEAIYQQYDHLLHVSDSATPNIRDPMLGHNISWNWGRSHFETFMRRLDEGRTWATKAVESKEKEQAFWWWQKIFGEAYFPSNVDSAASDLATAALPGRSYVTPAGILLSAKPASGMSIPVQRTTFHGETEI